MGIEDSTHPTWNKAMALWTLRGELTVAPCPLESASRSTVLLSFAGDLSGYTLESSGGLIVGGLSASRACGRLTALLDLRLVTGFNPVCL